MKKVLVGLLCIMILPSLAWGDELKPGIDIEEGVEQSVEPSPRLMVPAEGVFMPGEYELTATYFKDGEFFFTESIRFRAADGSRSFVELLMFSSEEKQEFLNGKGYPTAKLEHPNGAVNRLNWKDLRELGQSWKATEGSLALPVSVTTSGRQPAADGVSLVFAASGTCLDDCNQEFDWCEDSCNGDQYCIDWCEHQRDICRDNCCPFVTEYWVTTLQSETFTGATKCLEDHQFSGGKVYKKMERTWKHTKYRETEECDGTTTTAVIDVTYSVDFCWKRTSNVCYAPDPNSQFYCQY